MVRTGAPVMSVGSVATGEFGAPPPPAVALLVSVPGAVVPGTVTLIVIAGNAEAGAIATVVVQVTVCPTSEQLHVVPLADA